MHIDLYTRSTYTQVYTVLGCLTLLIATFELEISDVTIMLQFVIISSSTFSVVTQ